MLLCFHSTVAPCTNAQKRCLSNCHWKSPALPPPASVFQGLATQARPILQPANQKDLPWKGESWLHFVVVGMHADTGNSHSNALTLLPTLLDVLELVGPAASSRTIGWIGHAFPRSCSQCGSSDAESTALWYIGQPDLMPQRSHSETQRISSRVSC